MTRGLKKRLERLEDRVSLAQGSSLTLEVDPKVYAFESASKMGPTSYLGQTPEVAGILVMLGRSLSAPIGTYLPNAGLLSRSAG
jgi:hypothetical protein